jgi:hypothetical protein
MKQYMFSLLFSGLLFSAFAQDMPPAELEFKSDKFDFGAVEEGQQAIYSFEFVNKGSDTITLGPSDVRASCGCTTPDWTKTPLAPGQSGYIKAVYNSQGRPGVFNKTVTVFQNGQYIKVLKIKGIVYTKDTITAAPAKGAKVAAITLAKTTVEAGTLERNQRVDLQVKVTNTGKAPLSIIRMESACGCIVGKLVKTAGGPAITELAPGESGIIELNYGPQDLGDNLDYIILTTNLYPGKYVSIAVVSTMVESFQKVSPIQEENKEVPFGK